MTLFETQTRMLDRIVPVGLTGGVTAVRGLTVSVADFPAPVGAGCSIACADGGLDAHVVGFDGEQTLVMPMGPMTGIRKGDRVSMTCSRQTVGVSGQMLGRVLNARGEPIDDDGPIPSAVRLPLWPGPIDPMRRRRIDQPMPTGVRALDAMLTVGRGQRMGIFSGSGVGKSVLLGMIARGSAADVTVIALIGERGREVRDFIERDLGLEGLARSVVIASTGDEPPLARVRAAAVATAVAEYFRDCGKDVVLLLDSLTRLAAAQRQIGLAAGEPPTTRGLPPSVFNLLPELLERAGRTENGSVTGFYSVLMEADDPAEPIAEAVRSVSDGHVHLSADQAAAGRYPAVDVLRSISRVMIDVTDPEHRHAADALRRQISAYREIEDLVNIGAYREGASQTHDLAIRAMPWIREFLAQPVDQAPAYPAALAELQELYARIDRARDADPPSGSRRANNVLQQIVGGPTS